MENKIIAAALAISIALISWSLTTTVGLKTDVALLKEKVTQIEKTLDQINEPLSPLKDFILPGGTQPAARCHQARSVCRRAERRLLVLAEQQSVSNTSIKYLNRLSDLLFVMARHLNQAAGVDDVLWRKSFASE